jgi:hypothetical protein
MTRSTTRRGFLMLMPCTSALWSYFGSNFSAAPLMQ